MERRPLNSRDTGWAKLLARKIAGAGISPNMISVMSVIFSILGFLSFININNNLQLYLFLSALCIQLRLLCNLFDGMVAVEYNKATSMGEVYNDLPDRIADVFFIMGAGLYCKSQFYGMEIAWLASLFAVMTAYIRVLGHSVGTSSFFSGPMAKPHRMFTLTVACLVEMTTIYLPLQINFIYFALWIILVGSLVTCVRRVLLIKKAKA